MTLTDRCVQAWAKEHIRVALTIERRRLLERGIRTVLEHLAAELMAADHEAAARWLMAELSAQVIELRPHGPEDAA